MPDYGDGGYDPEYLAWIDQLCFKIDQLCFKEAEGWKEQLEWLKTQ